MSERKGSSSFKYDEIELRRGPWTLEEDTLLIHYIACHGEGRWNLLARCSGLKRTGKSCRLRWLNYLKPDVKRGNISPEEQLLILELHSRWGNRWSRIAQHLPGRTDNEIKNYWRTRVQKQARQLKIDANSTLFRDALRCYWMPRLLDNMGSSPTMQSVDANTSTTTSTAPATTHQQASYLDSTSIGTNMQFYKLSTAAAEIICSPSTSSCSAVLPQPLASMSEFPTNLSDELDDMAFNSLSGGYSMNNAYQLDAWDPDPISDSTPSFSTLDHIASDANCSKTIADSLWSMDELYDMLESYMNN
ncbi:hypothetical protein Cni_G06437 [Canna indica]|uniref:Uncharacterized protein n=1 Tax=Canna indica TaxID=4628 RepID=A0AAQ3JWJ3_9LILI|nr:hypothetical protein Cni_G06437 [Canna indica]